MKSPNENKSFQMMRVSTCGNQLREVVAKGLTREECADLDRFPAGLHEHKGKQWFYTHSLM